MEVVTDRLGGGLLLLRGWTLLRSGDGPVEEHAKLGDVRFAGGVYAAQDDGPKLVSMGQQTCFLHAAMREEHPSTISVELNGKEL